jgi:hypothetical protein
LTDLAFYDHIHATFGYFTTLLANVRNGIEDLPNCGSEHFHFNPLTSELAHSGVDRMGNPLKLQAAALL